VLEAGGIENTTGVFIKPLRNADLPFSCVFSKSYLGPLHSVLIRMEDPYGAVLQQHRSNTNLSAVFVVLLRRHATDTDNEPQTMCSSTWLGIC
jgi:hypothetical protein